MAQQAPDDQAILEDAARRIHFFDRPYEGFNPHRPEPGDLERFGIPPRPDDQALPNLARFWDEMWAPPLYFAEASYTLLSGPTSRLLRITASNQRESSLNWSGAYVTPRAGRQLTEIHAKWTVPGVAVPTGMPLADYHSSTWIGFDGQRRYFDASLPQIGTVQRVGAGSLAPYAIWWQWWLRNNPLTYKPFETTVPLIPGQVVMASLRVVDEYRVHFSIVNRTTNVPYPPFTFAAPTDVDRGFQPRVSGATAEWIVERPSDLVTYDLEELADYTSVQFTECRAVTAELPPGGVPGTPFEQSLEGARVINMYKVERNPSRRVTISRTERPNVDNFTTYYVDP